LLSTLVEGTHYLVDIIAGVLIALASLAILALIRSKRAERPTRVARGSALQVT